MESQVELVKAAADDLEELHRMQTESFMPLYEIYHDDLSPVNETKERTRWKINESDFLFIVSGGVKVGAIRVVRQRDRDDDKIMWISPVFILPQYQGKGLGKQAIKAVFERWDRAEIWRLATIKQEERNCRLYEKLGFVRVGEEEPVNDLMTLVSYERRALT